MKTRIEKFSVHQNGKVFAVLMAVSCLVFVVPFLLIATFTGPQGSGFPMLMIIMFPVLYLVFGYLMVAAGCWVYNIVVKYTGGIEFESRSAEAHHVN